MAGIPVHKSSPINTNAAKAISATPTTSQHLPHDVTNRSGPTSTTATTTATSTSQYTPAQPGAVAGPAPTGTSRPPPTNPTSTIPPPPTQTFKNPPAPQPGAVPSPNTPPRTPGDPSIPPPPKANEIPKPSSYYAPQYEPQQQQQQAPPAFQPYQQPTSTLNTPARAIPPSGTTSIDLSHPPGYIQNSRASFEESYRPYENNNTTTTTTSSSTHRGGFLDNDRSAGYDQEGDNSLGQIWDTAKSWAKTAGEKLKEGEEEVWRRVNGEK